MSVILKSGKTKNIAFPVTVSTEFTKDTLVYVDTTVGTIKPATSSAAGNVIAGVIRQTIASTDDNYADAREVLIEVPVEKNVIYEMDVTASLATTDVFKYLDLTDAGTVNPAASTLDIAFCTKYLSTTKGEFVLNIGAESLGVIGA